MLEFTATNHEGCKIIIGDWFEDSWITPYLRMELPAYAAGKRVGLSFFIAGQANQVREIVFRNGLKTVHTAMTTVHKQRCDATFVLPDENPTMPDEAYSLSITVDQPFSKPNANDARDLGLVLINVTLHNF